MLYSEKFRKLRAKTELPDNMWYDFFFQCMDAVEKGSRGPGAAVDRGPYLHQFYQHLQDKLEENHYFIDPA